jgi:hypothetical protein
VAEDPLLPGLGLRALPLNHAIFLAVVVFAAFVLGVFAGAAGKASYFPHLEAAISWFRLHTVLRGAAVDVSLIASHMFDMPVVLTSAADHSSVMAVLITSMMGARRVMRRGRAAA